MGTGEFAIVVGGVMMGILVVVMFGLVFGCPSCGREGLGLVSWLGEV